MAFRDGKTRSQTRESVRAKNCRAEREVKSELPKVCFSFKDIDRIQCPPGQTYEEWQKDELLAYMLTKFGYVCDYNIIEAQQAGVMTIYRNFPPNSDFKIPRHISGDVEWAVIKDIKGQKGRVAGYVVENVFHVVFLDKNHRFYKMKER